MSVCERSRGRGCPESRHRRGPQLRRQQPYPALLLFVRLFHRECRCGICGIAPPDALRICQELFVARQTRVVRDPDGVERLRGRRALWAGRIERPGIARGQQDGALSGVYPFGDIGEKRGHRRGDRRKSLLVEAGCRAAVA